MVKTEPVQSLLCASRFTLAGVLADGLPTCREIDALIRSSELPELKGHSKQKKKNTPPEQN